MKCWFAVVAAALLLCHETLAFSEALSDEYLLEWEYNESNIEMTMTAATRGYVGVGFSETTTMEDADIIIAGVGLRDVPYVWDCYSAYNGDMQIDREQDVVVIRSFQNNTHTSATISKPLFSNRSDDKSIKAGEINVIWAFGSKDKGPLLSATDYHGRDRGLRRLTLLRDNSRKELRVDTETRVSKATTISPKSSPTESSSQLVQSPDQNTAKEKFSQPMQYPDKYLTTVQIENASQQAQYHNFSTTTLRTENYTQSNQYAGLQYKINLDRSKQVYLEWDFDDETITLQLTAPTTGWIGLGFSTKVSMIGADLIMMGKRSDGIYAIDCHAKNNGVPMVDDDQNIEILSGWENGTHTSVTIKRYQMPCNEQDMNINLDKTLRVLWAYGQEDLKDEAPSYSDYHGYSNRGGRSLLLTNEQQFTTLAGIRSDWKQWDATVQNFSVPVKSTYYRCILVKVPFADRAFIKAYQPVIDAGNEDKVHHIQMYGCSKLPIWARPGFSGECYTQINPFSMGCGNLFAGWAVGAIGVVLPENIAIPLPQYVLIELHYDNPAQQEFLDNSGLRFHYTHIRPQIKMATLPVSEPISHIIAPPQTENFMVSGFCQEECLSKGMEISNISEVTVYSSFLHSHTAGRAIRVRHFRDGKELKPLTLDENYDFDYQEARYLPATEAKIRRGDSLKVECDYDTRGRENVTTGGMPTSSEMCIAFLTYYPAVDLTRCSSRPKIFENPLVAQKLVSNLGLSIDPEEWKQYSAKLRSTPFQMEAASPLFNRVEWTDEKRRILAEFIKRVSRSHMCFGQNGLILDFNKEFATPVVKDYVKSYDDKCHLKLNITQPNPVSTEQEFAALYAAAAAIVLLLAGIAMKMRLS